MTLLANAGFAGEIRRFTDNHGTLHISNVDRGLNPETSKESLSFGISESSSGNLPIIPPGFELTQATPEEGTTPVPVINSPNAPLPDFGAPVSQSHDVEALIQEVYEIGKKLEGKTASMQKPLSTQEIAPAPPLPPPASNDTVVSFKDHRGVIHIVSQSNEMATRPIQLAGLSPPPEESSPEPSSPASQQVSWPERSLTLAASPSTISFAHLSTPPGNTIRHCRDYLGVWRVINNAAAEMSPLPAIPATPGASAAENRPVPALLNLLPASAVAGAQPVGGVGPVAGSQTIVSRRDLRGVYHIFNLAGSGSDPDPGGFASLLGKIPPDLEPIIVEASQIYHLPVPLILALIRNESNFAHQAISPKGAMGLMQLMPGTAALLGVKNPFSPRENIMGGCRYFRFLLDHFQGSLPLALAAYNAGSQRVISAGYQVPPIKETQGFVSQVMALYYLLEKLSAIRL